MSFKLRKLIKALVDDREHSIDVCSWLRRRTGGGWDYLGFVKPRSQQLRTELNGTAELSDVGTMGTGGYIVPPSSGRTPCTPKPKVRLMSKF